MDKQPKARKVPVPSEHEEQKALFHWAELARKVYPELVMLYASPNGGKRHIGVARKLKAEGVKAGVPDICLPVARGGFHGLYIELKRRKGGKASEAQMDWIGNLRAQGYRAQICYGWDEARDVLVNYMSAWTGARPKSIGE